MKMKNALLVLALAFCAPAIAQNNNYQSHTANLGNVKIRYLKAGTGKKTLVLIHGFGDTSHMWIPLFDEFGTDYTILAPDMRGLGDSSRPATGYDKKTIAADIRELVKSLGYQKIDLVGHDIGLMVAYSYAAQYRTEVEKLALLEAPIPGIGDIWEKIYAKSYAQEGAMRAAFEMFKTFDIQDAADNRKFAATKLPIPVLTIEGDKAMGGALEAQAKLIATNVTSIVFTDTGHWLM